MKSKKGLFPGFAFVLMIVFFLIAAVSVMMLFFNQNIKDATALFVGFLNSVKIYVLIAVLTFIAWKIGLFKFAQVLLKKVA